ncbi:MAG TPA: TolC family protein [Noviherbaspirillum sp.]|nr:TolC family protein [Noviherbaspirillum sp.]
MHYLLLPLCVVALAIPVSAQTLTGQPDNIPTTQLSISTNREPTGPLTLRAALDLALQSNPDLLAIQYELEAVEGALLQAGARPNPSVEFLVQDTRRETRETTVQLSQPIELGAKRAARVRAAEHGRTAAAAELNAKRAEVRAGVINSFFDVVTAQERIRLAQDSAELAQRATTVASKRVVAGKVSPVEETKARVAESAVRLELTQAKAELNSARQRLAATWGSSVPRFGQAEGQLDALPNLPDPRALSQQLSQSPTMARARAELERRQALSDVERSRRVPDVTLNLGMKRSEELGRNQAIVGVAIPLPLFDTNHGNVLEALRREDKARTELKAAEVRQQTDLAQAFEKLAVSRQEAESLRREVIPGAQSAYDAATEGFEYGKFGFLDVLDAQRTLLQAKAQYLRSLAEAQRAAAEIERMTSATATSDK